MISCKGMGSIRRCKTKGPVPAKDPRLRSEQKRNDSKVARLVFNL